MRDWTAKLVTWAKSFKGLGGKLPSWWAILKGMIFHTGGEGPSVTKGAYAYVCVVTGMCLMVMVGTFCRVYLKTQTADSIFAGSIGLVGGLFMGFATSAHKKKNAQTANQPTPDPGASDVEDPAAKV